MSTKAILKTCRDKLNKKDFSGARDSAERVLDFESSNYTAHVFLAVALLELGENARCEEVYQKAIGLEPDQLLARQGLAKAYERWESWDKLCRCLNDLAAAYSKANDANKLAETLQRLLEIRRNHGTKEQLVDALLLFLPGSPFYTVLSSLPEPDWTNPTSSTTFQAQSTIHNSLPTLQEIVGILEADEAARSTREFNTRRTRLGAPKPDQIRRDVDREICEGSKLPGLYNEILNHPKASDELLLETEAKLLQYRKRFLFAVPSSDSPLKSKLFKELEDLVNGAILLKRQDISTWSIYLDWQDYDDVADLDPRLLATFVELFPENPLSDVLRGYFLFHNKRVLEDEGEAKKKVDLNTSEEGLDTILNCPTSPSDCVLAIRIFSEAYIFIEDFENASSQARLGLKKLDEIEALSGRSLPKTRTGFQVVLLTSLVHLFPPKHHVQAMSLIDQVLKLSPRNIKALMAKGFVLQVRKHWDEAKEAFDQVVGLSEDTSLALRAQEESAWCEGLLGGGQTAIERLKDVYKSLEALEINNELELARCLWRIGQTYWNLDGDDRQHAFANFIAALKKDPEYAAAFTSLGLHYADFASPSDPIRASKCFQKAFELDPRETVAAERLANGFAEEQEWELVEVIARRTIEGEGGLDAGVKSAKEGDAPTNVWAWKALGVVDLQNSNFTGAIQAFQVALRANPEDANLWLRLGEAYSKAGRYAAAVKTLNRAQLLNPDDWLPRYFLALSRLGVGLYEEAITELRELQTFRPMELGVWVSLGQAHLQLGLYELNSGFKSRAELSFVATIRLAVQVINQHPGFRAVAWKMVTDAMYHLSRLFVYHSEADVEQVVGAVSQLLPQASEDLKEVVSAGLEDGTELQLSARVLQNAVRSTEFRVGLGSSKKPEHAAWYDLAIGLQVWGIVHSKQVAFSPLVIKYLSKAVKQDPLNDRYWISLGIAYFSSNPRASQHALVKALELDGKNALNWATLGLLYLHHGDISLAEEVFLRAQTLDPDCTVSWIGQGLVAQERGDTTHANALFVHATTLDGVVPEADYNTSQRLFDAPCSPLDPPSKHLDALLPAYYLLARYTSRRPMDAAGLHLYALICERLGHISYGRELVERAIEILERVYEVTEDPVVEKQFMVANATLGRLILKGGRGDVEGCLPCFESVLALVGDGEGPTEASAESEGQAPVERSSSEKEERRRRKERRRVLEVQARMGVGMAQLNQGDLESALTSFQEALRLAEDGKSNQEDPEDLTKNENGDKSTKLEALRSQAAIALSQVLWSLQTVEYRDAAKTELLNCISDDPSNLSAIKTLAGMGILSNDEGLLDAAVSEIVGLPLDQRQLLDRERNVDGLLERYHLSRNELPQALQLSQKNLFNKPGDTSRRNALASLLLKGGNPQQALAVLGNTSVIDLRERGKGLLLKALALTSPSTHTQEEVREAKKSAQRAVMLRPGSVQAWKVLAKVRDVGDRF
ncbi:superkiller protein 3 SKI3 [Coprinopsis sp. MPI-PUGE-AT-0042]|nr:superkiller protein 3 SKI3 [Coprinopsis sp. MPI-PUGE-AT-0042]